MVRGEVAGRIQKPQAALAYLSDGRVCMKGARTVSTVLTTRTSRRWGPDRKVGGGLPIMSGSFWSDKAERPLQTEGGLELLWCTCWEVDPAVVQIQDQPATIWYAFDPRTGEVCLRDRGQRAPAGFVGTHYTPDYLLFLRSGRPKLMEVKRRQDMGKPEIIRALAAGRLWAASRGWEFEIVDDTIRSTVRLQNADLLIRYRTEVVPEAWMRAAVAVVRDGPVTVARLCRQTGEPPWLASPWCYALIYRGVLDWSQTGALGARTRVWLAGAAR